MTASWRCGHCGEPLYRSSFCRGCEHRRSDLRELEGHESARGVARLTHALSGQSHE